jgi:hypothetical protein
LSFFGDDICIVQAAIHDFDLTKCLGNDNSLGFVSDQGSDFILGVRLEQQVENIAANIPRGTGAVQSQFQLVRTAETGLDGLTGRFWSWLKGLKSVNDECVDSSLFFPCDDCEISTN